MNQLTETIRSGIPAAWREVRAIVAGMFGLCLLLAVAKRPRLALTSSLLLGWVFYFFRDPERVPTAAADDLIFAPADGKVTHIELVDEPEFFKGRAWRVSVFLSLVDVHVQRCPYPGRVDYLHYEPGNFAPAFFSDTAGNEFNFVGISTPRGPIGVKQIAGVLARRIVCWPQIGDSLSRGQRLGLVKFGS
ncbi:MAG: phosphatidylserine decarboxylase, partial [Anaerolineae bacterium]|nr:phosphatidylserine decarboxylase [Anaerolineae bacterium]